MNQQIVPFVVLIIIAILLGVIIQRIAGLQKHLHSLLEKGLRAQSSQYPCFTAWEVQAAWQDTEALHATAKQLEESLESRPDWKAKAKPFTPSAELRKHMESVCVACASWQRSLMRYEFMIEGNLRVIRGEKTIAEVRGMFNRLPGIDRICEYPPPIAAVHLADWLRRLNEVDVESRGDFGMVSLDRRQQIEDSKEKEMKEFVDWQERRFTWTEWKLPLKS